VALLCAQGALTGDLHLLRVVRGLIITRGENIDAERMPQDGVSAARQAASRLDVAAGLLSELAPGLSVVVTSNR
jgi:hypothetical protein